MRFLKYSVCGIILVLLFSACNDLFIKNISNEQIVVKTPIDNFVSDKFSVTFSWEKIKSAQEYHLQIVTPSFDSIFTYALDTIILSSSTTATISLFPGVYEWRLYAKNSLSQTSQITRKLRVDTNKDLSNQIFIVSQPPNNSYFKDTVVNFNWSIFPYADEYEYTLSDTNSNILKTIYTSGTQLTDTIAEGTYLWKVLAINKTNNSKTQYSSPRSLTIDITPPQAPILLSPLTNTIVPNPVKLTWNSADDSYEDEIIVANDSVFTNLVIQSYLKDSASHILQPLIKGNQYYWKIRTRDKAGNWSGFSSHSKFIITL